MAKRKPKPPHPILASIEAAQKSVAEEIGKRLRADALKAYEAIVEIGAHGDLNGERRQASLVILKIAGVVDKPAASTTKVTAQQADGGTIKVVIVEDTKPHAEDDDD